MQRSHSPGYGGLVSESLRDVAFVGDPHVALLGWAAAAPHTPPRDRSLGWDAPPRARRLPWLVNNTRHTVTSRRAMAGVDLDTAQRAGGWKTQVMVQRYAHPSPDHVKAAVERLAQSRNSGGAIGTKPGAEA